MRDEAPLVDLALNKGDPTNYGYEGCSATHLAWTGAHFVCVSREQSRAHAWRVTLPPRTSAHATVDVDELALSTAHAIVGNTVACLDDEPGLVTVFDLERFEWCAPLPLPSPLAYATIERVGEAAVRVSEGGKMPFWQMHLPSAAQRRPLARDPAFLDIVATRLIGGPNPGTFARLVIDAAALPYVQLSLSPHAGVSWLPLYVLRLLMESARLEDEAQLRSAIERLATPKVGTLLASSGWSSSAQPIEHALSLAATRVYTHAFTLRAALPTLGLPRGQTCTLFASSQRGGPGARIDRAALTPTLTRWVDELVPTAPKELAHSW